MAPLPRPLALGLFAAGLLGMAPLCAAQSTRQFTAARQRHGETRLDVAVEYAAGTVTILASDTGALYRMRLAYDEDRYVPLSAFDPRNASVSLGLRATGGGGIRVSSSRHLEQFATIELSPSVDLALDVTLGAAEGAIDLGRLKVRDLTLKAGASQATLRFSKLNPIRCARADVSAGAAELTITGLGNSRCAELDVDAGVGKVTLDFGGTSAAPMHANVKMAMGELVLRFPKNAGVRITVDKFLASFAPTRLVREGTTYVTPNYARATPRIDLDLTSAIGGVRVEWVD